MTQQLTKDDLRGCPFCGGLGDIDEIKSGCFGVGCQDCDFQLMNGTIGLGWHKSESDAIRAWNERNSDLCIQGLQDWTKKLQSSLDAANSRIAELEQGKCLHQIAEPAAAPQSALVEALRAVCTDMVAVGNGQHAITDAARDKVEALQGVIFSAAPQAVQPAVPTDADIDAAMQAFDWDGWIDQEKAKRAFTREALVRWTAPAHPAEGVSAQAAIEALGLLSVIHQLAESGFSAGETEYAGTLEAVIGVAKKAKRPVCAVCSSKGFIAFEDAEARTRNGGRWGRCTSCSALAAPQPAAQQFQARVGEWLIECFGHDIAHDGMERNHRFLEEALELVQSLGCTASEAHQLVDYVYGRPVGEPVQELGGVMVTLAALCFAHELDMAAGAEKELSRICDPVTMAKIKTKQAASHVTHHCPSQQRRGWMFHW
ncbi:Lar family restriction alleviation protein [Comamonas sp.]|uniref:Lar family restriction alleviation protein n=1 Tax=Comamonas sp. TaxID=34028 RepID=UPI00258A0827|nr:Lar family restriction alleviation protein [Comamonas sp.]